MSRPAALEIEGLSKTFGGTRVLDDVALRIEAGSVHGLLGHNGCGKSTLIKVLSGFHESEPGTRIRIHGRTLTLPLQAGGYRSTGMSFVHQNLALVPSLSVLENLRVAAITRRGRLAINWHAEAAAARTCLERYEVDLPIQALVSSLTPAQRALLAIVRAIHELEGSRVLHGSPGLMFLDEPTPFLPQDGVDQLFALVRRIVADGASVVYISHDIDEVLELTDRATILRSGRVAGQFESRCVDRDEAVRMIIGHAVEPVLRSPSKARRDAHPALEVRGMRSADLPALDLEVERGQIVGLTGLIGSGYEKVLYHLFGSRCCDGGALLLDGAPMDLARWTPAAAIAAGIALLPADRAMASGVGACSAQDNMLLPALSGFFRRGRLDLRRMRQRSRALGETYQVRPNSPERLLSSFSGGNAQKVLFARWMQLEPRVLLLDEPTQGVDMGTRQHLLRAVRSAAAQGMTVLCASSDLEQLAELCDRVLVFDRGRIRHDVSGALTKTGLTHLCYQRNEPTAEHIGTMP